MEEDAFRLSQRSKECKHHLYHRSRFVHARVLPLFIASLVVCSSSQEIPGASLACNRGQDDLNSAINAELSSFQAANANCLMFCNPLSGTHCDADCSEGLDALQASCHSESAHVYSVTLNIDFVDGLGQEVIGYTCLAEACSPSDVMTYKAWRESQHCSPIANLSFLKFCVVTVALDDIVSDSEVAVTVAGAVIVALTVVAVVIVGSLSLWRFRSKSILGIDDSTESAPILYPASCRASSVVSASSGTGETQTAGETSASRRNPDVSADPGSTTSNGAEAVPMSSRKTSGISSAVTAPPPKGSTRGDVYKSRYGAASVRPLGAVAQSAPASPPHDTNLIAPLLQVLADSGRAVAVSSVELSAIGPDTPRTRSMNSDSDRTSRPVAYPGSKRYS